MDLILSKDDQLNVWDFSVKLSKSKMVPVAFQNKAEDVFVTVLYGREFGLTPIMALHSICVIQGQVTLKVATMNAIVRAKCPQAIIDIKQDHLKKEVRVLAKRNKDDVGYESFWNMETAKQMGLSSKNNWISQPMNMLRARALSEALRVVFADVLCGFYAAEEMEDVQPEKNLVQIMHESLDQDFPIPPEEKIVGPLYRVQNGKFRNLQFKDIDLIELESYADDIDARKTKKTWETQLSADIRSYLANYSLYREQIAELDAEAETAQP